MKTILSRLDRLERATGQSEGDYILCTMMDGTKEEQYYSDAWMSILEGRCIAVEELPEKTQNGEGLAFARVLLISEGEDAE